jgi:hypothetical protein
MNKNDVAIQKTLQTYADLVDHIFNDVYRLTDDLDETNVLVHGFVNKANNEIVHAMDNMKLTIEALNRKNKNFGRRNTIEERRSKIEAQCINEPKVNAPIYERPT